MDNKSYRPYKGKEVLDLIGEIACSKIDDSRYVIVEVFARYSTVRLATITMSTDVLLKEFNKLDGTPFGVITGE